MLVIKRRKPSADALFGIGIPLICKLFITAMPGWSVIVASVLGTVVIARVFYTMEKKAGKV